MLNQPAPKLKGLNFGRRSWSEKMSLGHGTRVPDECAGHQGVLARLDAKFRKSRRRLCCLQKAASS